MSDLRTLHTGVTDRSHDNVSVVRDSGVLNQHYGAIIYNQTIHTPHVLTRPAIPRCPAPCVNYTSRVAIENHMCSYFFTPCWGMKRYVLHGPGGAGKTEIGLAFVNAFCYSQAPENRWFPDALWVDATTDETIAESFKAIGLSIGVGPKIEDVLCWLASRSGRDANWITIFNNADDPKLDLTKYFPNCSHGNILIATRNYHARRYGAGPGSDCEVSEMTAEEALTLFRKHARLFGDANPSSIKTAKVLVEEIGRFALAVTQAGAYISTSRCSLSQYRVLYRDQRQELLHQYEEMPATHDYEYRTLHATWMISYVRLSDPAKELFQVFGCIHHEGIKEDMFANAYSGGMDALESRCRALFTEKEKAGLDKLKRLHESLSTNGKWDAMKFRRLVNELQSYSLITFDPERGTCSIHPLVHKWVGDVCDLDEQAVLRQCTILLLGSCIVRWETTEELAFCRALVCHVDRIFQGVKPHATACGDRFGIVYWEAGRWEDVVVHEELFRELCGRVLGEEHLNTLASTNNLASTYLELGRSNDAKKFQLQAVKAQKRLLGPEHPSTLTSMNNLALTYSRLGRFNNAEKLQLQVLEARKRVLGPEHPDTLTSMNDLGLTYSKLGWFSDAEKLQLEVVRAQKRVLGPEHPDTLTSMNNLASTYSELGRSNDAEKLQLQVLEIRGRILGPEHPATLTSMNDLALTYLALGMPDYAEKLQLQVLKAQKRVLGPEHPSTLTSVNNLALTFSKLRRFNDAEQLQLRVLEVRKRVLGPEHPDTLTSMNALALIYSDLGRLNDAENLELQLMEVDKKTLGPEHPHTLISMGNLALTYSALGRPVDAETLQLQVVEAQKNTLGPEHPSTLISAYNLAYIYRDQGKFAEAEDLSLQTLMSSQQVFGAHHPNTISVGKLLSEVQQQQRSQI